MSNRKGYLLFSLIMIFAMILAALFLQNIFDFVIIAAAIFMALRAINKLKTPPPRPPIRHRPPTSSCWPRSATC